MRNAKLLISLVYIPLFLQAIMLLVLGLGPILAVVAFCCVLGICLHVALYSWYKNESICTLVVCVSYGGLGMLLGQYFEALWFVPQHNVHVHHLHNLHTNGLATVASSNHNHASLLSAASVLMVLGCYLPCIVKSVLTKPSVKLLKLMLSHLYIIPPMLIAHIYLLPAENIAPLWAYGLGLAAMVIGLIVGLMILFLTKEIVGKRWIKWTVRNL